MNKNIPEALRDVYTHIEAGFLGFWVRKYRISYLITIALFVL